MKKILSILSISLFLFGCSSSVTIEINNENKGYFSEKKRIVIDNINLFKREQKLKLWRVDGENAARAFDDDVEKRNVITKLLYPLYWWTGVKRMGQQAQEPTTTPFKAQGDREDIVEMFSAAKLWIDATDTSYITGDVIQNERSRFITPGDI